MVARGRAAIERLDQRLAAAKADGAMKFINAEYRRRRIEASASRRKLSAISRR